MTANRLPCLRPWPWRKRAIGHLTWAGPAYRTDVASHMVLGGASAGSIPLREPAPVSPCRGTDIPPLPPGSDLLSRPLTPSKTGSKMHAHSCITKVPTAPNVPESTRRECQTRTRGKAATKPAGSRPALVHRVLSVHPSPQGTAPDLSDASASPALTALTSWVLDRGATAIPAPDQGCGRSCEHFCGHVGDPHGQKASRLFGHSRPNGETSGLSDETRASRATLGTRRRRPRWMTGSSPRATSS